MATIIRYGFGKLAYDLRLQKGKSLRETARALGIAPSYLSRVENNEKPSLSPERIDALAAFLVLSEDTKQELYALAAQPNITKEEGSQVRKGVVPADCAEYVRNTPAIIETLRFAKEIGMGEQEWREVLENLKINNQGA